MKRIILLSLILVSVMPLKAQKEEGLKKSTIHFVRNASRFGRDCQIEIVLPNQRTFQISPKSIASFTIYSTGKVPITFNRTCISSNPYGSSVKTDAMQEVLEVETGKEYYIFFKAHKLEGQVKKSEILSDIDKAKKNTLLYTENLDFPINPESIKEKEETLPGQGTGFLVNNQGYILTNHHVIKGAKKINIKGIKGDYNTSFEAKVISIDPQNDIALLKVESKIITFNNPPYQLGNSLTTTKAEDVYALGYPMKDKMGEELKVTDGIISSLTGYEGSVSMFQFSANVNPGNSGGPLLNKNGEVIGITTAKTITGTEESIAYAVKADYIKLLLEFAKVDFTSAENSLAGKELPEQVLTTTPFIYIIETE